MRRTPLVAVGLTVLLVLSVLAVGGVATGSQATTELAECTTITEPGSYELTGDIEYGGGEDCIHVEADDVTIDGNGHTINNTESSDMTLPRGRAITVVDQNNITVRDVTFTEYAEIYVDDSTAVTIEHNTVNSILKIRSSSGLTIQDNYFATQEVDIQYSEEIRLLNNHIDGIEARAIYETANVTARDNHGDGELTLRVQAGEVVVANNSLHRVDIGAGEGTTVAVTRNDVGAGALAVSANGVARVHNNTVEGGGLALGGTSDDLRVAHNTITDADIGVSIAGSYEGGPAVTLERNVITDNRIGVRTFSDLPEIHRNDLSGNSEYGVVYTQDFGVVNATHNYWGDRPSSPEDEDAPFEDPETGALANGSGSAVSEGSAAAGAEEGVSNVHFDPWLDTAPDAGVVDQSSDGDDSNDQTTTTTTTTTSEDTTTTATTTNADTTTMTSDETTTTAATSEDTTTATATSDETTTANDDATTTSDDTTTTATTTAPPTTTATTNQSELITGTTTTSNVPGFGYLAALLALLGSALLAARHT